MPCAQCTVNMSSMLPLPPPPPLIAGVFAIYLHDARIITNVKASATTAVVFSIKRACIRCVHARRAVDARLMSSSFERYCRDVTFELRSRRVKTGSECARATSSLRREKKINRTRARCDDKRLPFLGSAERRADAFRSRDVIFSDYFASLPVTRLSPRANKADKRLLRPGTCVAACLPYIYLNNLSKCN